MSILYFLAFGAAVVVLLIWMLHRSIERDNKAYRDFIASGGDPDDWGHDPY